MQNSLNFAQNSFLRFAFALKQPKNIQLFCERKINTLNISSRKISKFSLGSKKISSKMANDEFCFNSYDLIGFDLDNCIVRYNVKNMIYLEYNCLAKFLVKRGYSKDFLLKPIEEDLDFLQKGLILDFEKGNLLRVSPDGHIQIATHGTKIMDKKEIVEIYSEEKRWQVTDVYCKDMLVAWNGTLSDLIRTCLDIFDMPAALAFARIIDSIDLLNGRQEKYNVWPDVLDGLMELYSREHFSDRKSEYFSELKSNTSKYVLKNSENVHKWLKSLKSNKKTFLVTGSHIDFASLTASLALGPNWRDYFDIIVCFAKKPGFFTNSRPFLKLEGTKETEIVTEEEMKIGQIYSQGNFSQLKRVLSQGQDSKVLYVGDNLIQDIFTPSHHKNLDTVAIVEEMFVENSMEFDENYKVLHSNLWGNYFHTNGGVTLWENIIRKHSKLCVPSIEELAKHSIDFKYPHKYYPHDPR